MIRCICINNKDRPEEIPESHWPKFGEEYTVKALHKKENPYVLGITLEEIDLREINFPEGSFRMDRFGFHIYDLIDIETLIHSTPGLEDADAFKLIEHNILIGETLEDFGDFTGFDGEDANLDDL